MIWESIQDRCKYETGFGYLFNGEKLDIITGLSMGGLYHIQIETSPNIGDINGDGGYNVLDIVALANCVLAQNCSG